MGRSLTLGFQWAVASLEVGGKEKLTDRIFFVRERGVLTRYMNRFRNPNKTNPNPFLLHKLYKNIKALLSLLSHCWQSQKHFKLRAFLRRHREWMWELALRQQKLPWCVFSSVPVLSALNQ